MHAAAAELDEEEHVEPPQTDGLDREEVDRERAVRLRAQEVAPGEPGALAGGPETRVPEELPHRGGRDRKAEPTQLADDPLITPTRIFTGQAQHQLTDLAPIDGRPTRPA
jgi:hypothetical protein